jgi:branched-chain amino acid transport system substrate-binding protein
MKIRPLPLLALCLLLGVQTVAAQERIKIGVSVPLTGDAATYGADIKNGLLFANKHLAAGAYELIIEDDHCSAKGAVTAARKLVEIDKVRYVLGFGCSGALLAAAPVYEKARVLAIGSATGAPAISEAGDYIFRTIPSLTVAAQKLYAHASRRRRSIGILTEETAYCQGLTDAFMKLNVGVDLSIINESFLPDTLDFRTLLARLRSKKIEALFINPQSESGLVNIVKQLKTLGWRIPLYAAYYPGSPVYLEAFGKEGDGIVYADLPFGEEMLNARGQKLFRSFLSEYGAPRSGDFNVTLSCLAFNALHEAIISGGDVKQYLYTQAFDGIVDRYAFDKNGDVVSDKITFVLKTIKNGKPAGLQIYRDEGVVHP